MVASTMTVDGLVATGRKALLMQYPWMFEVRAYVAILTSDDAASMLGLYVRVVSGPGPAIDTIRIDQIPPGRHTHASGPNQNQPHSFHPPPPTHIN